MGGVREPGIRRRRAFLLPTNELEAGRCDLFSSWAVHSLTSAAAVQASWPIRLNGMRCRPAALYATTRLVRYLVKAWRLQRAHPERMSLGEQTEDRLI